MVAAYCIDNEIYFKDKMLYTLVVVNGVSQHYVTKPTRTQEFLANLVGRNRKFSGMKAGVINAITTLLSFSSDSGIISSFTFDKKHISFKDGIYNMEIGLYTPHDLVRGEESIISKIFVNKSYHMEMYNNGETPTMDKILSDQGITIEKTPGVYHCFFAMVIGNIFYPAWKLCSFIVGKSGTGKSTIAMWLMSIIKDTTIVANSQDPRWIAGTLKNKSFWCCTDMLPSCSWTLALFLTLTGDE